MKKTDADIIKKKLEAKKWFRERKFRHFGIDHLALIDVGVIPKGAEFDKDREVTMTNRQRFFYARRYDSWRHAWDEVLRDPKNAHLRGSDYKDKTRLEMEWQLKHGYEVGYFEDITQKYI